MKPDIVRFNTAAQCMCIYRWSPRLGDYHFYRKITANPIPLPDTYS